MLLNQYEELFRENVVMTISHLMLAYLFPAAAMVVNLENQIYQHTVLNNKTRSDLVGLFSSLDDCMDYRVHPHVSG